MTKEEVYLQLYRRISDKYDVRNILLSVVIRDCVEHDGHIPLTPSSHKVNDQYPYILSDIREEYIKIINKKQGTEKQL